MCKEPKKKKTKQILCHEIEPNPSKERAMHEGDNPSFLDEFNKIYFLLDSYIHIRISMYIFIIRISRSSSVLD